MGGIKDQIRNGDLGLLGIELRGGKGFRACRGGQGLERPAQRGHRSKHGVPGRKSVAGYPADHLLATMDLGRAVSPWLKERLRWRTHPAASLAAASA